MSARGSERPAVPPHTSAAGRSRSRSEHTEPELSLDELDVLMRVGELIRGLRFGTVLVVVQDGEVVQIELAEKIRLR